MLQRRAAQWFKQWFNHQSVAVSLFTKSSGETLSDDSRSFMTSLTINWYTWPKAPSQGFLGPAVSSGHEWLLRESHYTHPTPIIISGLQAFVLRLWRMLFCVCLKNYGCPVCKEGKKLPGIENRATTMLSQCFFLLLSLTNASWCNLTPSLF